MKFYENPGKLNIEGYRVAKDRALKKRLGVYIKVDGTNNIAIYLLSNKMEKLRIALSLIHAPIYIIRVDKKEKYGYYYARLIYSYSAKWQELMKNNNNWRIL